ncbi:GTP pyrophosphokinase [Pectobacterium versatile]|uniref:GTP pyrophosphokinase n=1 Tax=Pectobacterium versatile TaxID=2488639 RepID=UPI001F3E52A3|nr:RelA/SpoT domain-containing protein [Pectobacterium versatile]
MGDVINLFMERYNKEFDFYLNLSKIVEDDIRVKLHSFGVRAIVSSRAKSPKRLRDKIIDRNSVRSYSSVESIYSDIVDLAGVRVAIYFPGDMSKVEEIISTEFHIEEKPKTFPEKKKRLGKNNTYEKVFSGYAAKHFRVKMKGGGRYANNYPVEIQVASVLMHAWSEVEHDLVYKPLQGSLSHEELMILDEINGLVLSGNLALERLQLAGIKRTEADNYEFKNHYDLALFFISCLQENNIDSVNFNDIFKILKLMGRTKRNELTNVVSWIKSNPINKENPISASQIQIIKRDPDSQLYDYIIRAIVNVFPDDAVAIVEKFSKDIFGELELTEKAKESLFKLTCSYYLGYANYTFIDSIVNDYEINNYLFYKTEEESLLETINKKNVCFSKNHDEVIRLLDDYIKFRNQLNTDNFSKELLDILIDKNKNILSFTQRISNSTM